MQHVLRALGVENLDWRSGRQHQASPGAYGGTHVDLENAQLIVTLGRPPAQTRAGDRSAHSQSGARDKGALVSRRLASARSYVPRNALARGSPISTAVAAEAERIAFVWDGIDASLGAEAADAMAKLAEAGKHVHAFVPGEHANARGAEALGLLPRRRRARRDRQMLRRRAPESSRR